MPTYKYKCNTCYYEFTKLQSFYDPNPVCDKCNSSNMIRLISGGAAVHYKGTGFYTTDYKDK